MKKRSLFLSLICSIALTVALVAVTIASVLPKKNANKPTNPSTNVSQTVGSVNNEANDGTAQKPFVLYDAKSFIEYVSANGGKLVPVMEAVQEPVMIEKLDENGEIVVDAEGNTVFVEKTDENGNVVYQNKLDENGNIVYAEKLDENGKVILEGCHFVLNNDIDFAGVDFKPLFNQDKPFVGNIDGKGYALVNILMNVTTENFVKDFAYQYEDKKGVPVLEANIGVFGNIENAKIANIAFKNLNINVEKEVYAYVADAITIGEKKVSTLQISVGSVASMAKNSQIKVDVEANINATPYSRYSEKEDGRSTVDGYNTMGGVVSYAEDCMILNSKVDVEFVTEAGKNYLVGGLAGYTYKTIIAGVDVKTSIATYYKHANYVGGLVGYANTTDVNEANINLSVKELGSRFDVDGVSTIDENAFTWVGGIVACLGGENLAQSSSFTDVVVTSDVDIDAIYGGAIVQVETSKANQDLNNPNAEIFFEFNDVIVESKVNVLKAFGFAKFLCHTNINISENGYKIDVESGNDFNIKLTGTIKLQNQDVYDEEGNDSIDYAHMIFANIIGRSEYYCTINGGTTRNESKLVKIVCGTNIPLELNEQLRFTIARV